MSNSKKITTFGCPIFKNGSGIHIKEKNRGKFTASAKAAGESVQEHAKHVLNNPNATPLQKKRANFARNSKKWRHQEGGIMQTAAGLVPIYGTYLDYKQFKNNPSWGNFGNMALSGVGDVLQLTGLGYGLGTTIKGLKTANTVRKSAKAIQAARNATRLANQKKMLERGEVGKRAFQGWVQSGNNLRRSNQKLDKANQQRNRAAKIFGISLIEPSIEGFQIYNNFKN